MSKKYYNLKLLTAGENELEYTKKFLKATACTGAVFGTLAGCVSAHTTWATNQVFEVVATSVGLGAGVFACFVAVPVYMYLSQKAYLAELEEQCQER